ncbi:hypothetical protein [Pseudomonas sp.]|uniref:hypothetical protein n=1 Tax=Pseudomonas sp. TaxID=306 RepID=UPI0029A273AD|nr:hypothetical protein [Pseudomonas sp.]MDX3743729.1 hypothetical protein [Pseudomonas sp.]
MKETIYNFYVIIDEQDRVLWLGHIFYEALGTDDEKMALLRQAAERDYKTAKLTKPPAGMTLDSFNAMARLGTTLTLFEYAFKEHEPAAPLAIVTLIVNGAPVINYHSSFAPIDMTHVNKTLGSMGVMDDWLVEYSRDGAIDLPRLINDDFLKAYKLLFNNSHYTSATKLFLSCIDSLAYVEFGDAKAGDNGANVFCRWLNTYVDLVPVGVTAEELWELRNGLLHMSNLHSQRVQRKKVRRISISVGRVPPEKRGPYETTHYFNLVDLYSAVSTGIGVWLQTYVDNYEKFLIFVERWDRTISDSRLTKYTPD